MFSRFAGYRAAAAAAVAIAFLVPGVATAGDKPVLVFAAASLKNALDDVNAAWAKQSGQSATISYAGSSALAQQIEQGAPADVFIPADLDWMDYLDDRGFIEQDSRTTLLGNRLVLIAPKDATKEAAAGPEAPAIASGFDLAGRLKGGHLAMANTEAVPAGKYGKAALEKLGLWDSVKDRIAQADNVRAALLLVSRGEAPLGIVYATDAAADPGVRVVGGFPDDSHPPILYPAALTAGSDNPDAAAFLAFLRSPAAKPAFERQGFTVLGER